VECGAELSIDGEIVGHVTTPAYSRRLGKSLALVHLIPSAAVEGTSLEIKVTANLIRGGKLTVTVI
jgi:glycine cleavage system aminomethyltransferase T